MGGIAAVVPLPTATPSKKRLGTLLGTDPTGAFYFNVNEQIDTATKALSGVANVTRVVPGATTDEPQLTYRTRRADQTKPSGITPYIFRDAVAIRADGLMARVVTDTYQVIWVRNGKETGRTGPLPYVFIADYDHRGGAAADQGFAGDRGDEGNDQAARRPGGAPRGGSADSAARKVAFGDGGGGSQTFVIAGGGGGMATGMAIGAAGGQRVVINGTDVTAAATGAGGNAVAAPAAFNFADLPFGAFPATKPAILSSGVVAMFDYGGNLWVARERVHGDAVPHYDVIAEGKGVVAHVNLPTGTRLVGFGKNAVFLARDDEGSDWLERYAMPKM